MADNTSSFKNNLKTLGGLLLAGGIAFIFIFAFLFLIRFTPEYECVMDIVTNDPAVISRIGEPIEPAIYVLLSRYGSVDDSSAFEAKFRTRISGSADSDWVVANIYRSPIGSAMRIDVGDLNVYDGIYACP